MKYRLQNEEKDKIVNEEMTKRLFYAKRGENHAEMSEYRFAGGLCGR